MVDDDVVGSSVIQMPSCDAIRSQPRNMMSCPPVPRTIRPLFISVTPGDGVGPAIDGQKRIPNGDFAREDDLPADVEDHGPVAR